MTESSEQKKVVAQGELDAESAQLLLRSVKGYAIYMLDPGGHVVTWNTGAEGIKGFVAGEIIGQHFSVFYTPDDRQRGEPERELMAAINAPHEAESWRVRKNGERFWASVTMTALYDADGKLRGFAKVTRDLTDQRRAHEEQIRLERAEEALRLRDEFLAQTKSALNQVMVSIRIHLQSLRAAIESGGGATAASQAKLTTLEWGLDRLSRSVDQVLRIASETGERLLQEANRRNPR